MKKITFDVPDYKELEKGMKVVDMHTHTSASMDCNTKLRDFELKLRKLGIGVSITDHNEIKGSLAIKKRYPKQFLLPGIEVTTDEDKDILLYFNNFTDLKGFHEKHVKPTLKKHKTNVFFNKTLMPYEYLLDEAKDYNAFRVIPHPLQIKGLYKTLLKKKNFSILKKIEAIEVINCTVSLSGNLAALEWAHYEKMPMTGGSDSHMLRTIGKTVTSAHAQKPEDFLEQIRKKNNYVTGTANNWRTDMRQAAIIAKNKFKRPKKNRLI